VAKQTVNLGTSANKGDGDPLRTAFTKVNANFTEVYSLLGAEGGDVDDVVAPMLVHNSHTNVTVTRDDAANKIIFSVDPYDGDITGSVFGDDSTVLVDGVNNTIPKANIEDSANWDTAFGWGNHTAGGYAPQTTTYTKTEVDSAISAVNTLDGDITGSVFADDSTLLVDGVAGLIPSSVISGTEATNWNTAYGWGDHSVAGYLTSVPAQTFTSLTGKPTTLAGYSITDAATAAQGVLAASALQAETITLATLKTEVAASADFADYQTRIAAL
jgi:hypothetical protein